APASAWTKVQWQNVNNDWEDVTGWQGTLTQGSRRWWVDAKDFGTGPFRWVITDGKGGTVIATSDSFNLPQFPNDPVVTQLTVP
ncbi:MAG: hypothetical protein AAF485_24570, partial [Chloroflexota bacterium]